MKKVLTKCLYFVSAIAATMCAVSCTESALEDNVIGVQPQKKNSDVKVYSTDNVAGIGTRGTNVNGNEWTYKPEIPSQEEIDGVMAYIATKPEGVQWPGYKTYFIQQVGGSHTMYSYVDFNGASHSMDGTQSMETLSVVEDRELFDWEKVGVEQGWHSGVAYQHVNNFNAGTCNNPATNNCTLMLDGFKGAYALNEYSSTAIEAWRIFYWNGNYYLGLDYYCTKDDAKDKPAVAPDGCYDDWVVKIIPGAGEPPVTPPSVDPDPDPDPIPDPIPPVSELKGEVEFDVHLQEHKDWNEIKTSIHLRDTVSTRIFIPVPEQYQAEPDDFAIRVGDKYEYITKTIEYCDRTYQLGLTVTHTATGIEITVNADDTKMLQADGTFVSVPLSDALKAARATYYDGITFEVHTYVQPDVQPATIWEWLKNIECLQTSLSGIPVSGQCVTHTYGQTTTAYAQDRVDYVKDPE